MFCLLYFGEFLEYDFGWVTVLDQGFQWLLFLSLIWSLIQHFYYLIYFVIVLSNEGHFFNSWIRQHFYFYVTRKLLILILEYYVFINSFLYMIMFQVYVYLDLYFYMCQYQWLIAWYYKYIYFSLKLCLFCWLQVSHLSTILLTKINNINLIKKRV